ncbi:S24 family peptidase [Klebsiella quasipneumoniae]|uniref:S24 family peptidase n=1 Tax=Klebsiella quasipneumoniae TaxID=1463165 RepID=UPI002B062451|nr:S24 family peptidase [Klebsiella quasipneumoniae]
MPAFEWVHVQLHQQKGMISLSPPTICNSASATYYLRASGDSMADGSLYNGDLLVVDSAEKPRHGDIVVASVQGEFTVKRLLLTPRLTLQPMNASWSPIYPDPDELDIFGVVTHIIHRPREMY